MRPVRLARLLAERLEAEGERTEAAVTLRELLEDHVPYRVARGSLDLATKSEYDLLVLEFLADERLVVLREPELGEAAAEELETAEPGLEPLEEHADAALRLDLATISGGYRGSETPAAPPDPGTRPTFEMAPDAGGGASSVAEEEGRDSVPAEGADDEEEVGRGWDPTGGVEARPPDDSPRDEASGPADASAARGEESGAGEDAGTAAEAEPDVGAPGPECRACGRELPGDADVPVRFCPHCGAARPDHACPECGARLEPDWSYCPRCGAEA